MLGHPLGTLGQGASAPVRATGLSGTVSQPYPSLHKVNASVGGASGRYLVLIKHQQILRDCCLFWKGLCNPSGAHPM